MAKISDGETLNNILDKALDDGGKIMERQIESNVKSSIGKDLVPYKNGKMRPRLSMIGNCCMAHCFYHILLLLLFFPYTYFSPFYFYIVLFAFLFILG